MVRPTSGAERAESDGSNPSATLLLSVCLSLPSLSLSLRLHPSRCFAVAAQIHLQTKRHTRTHALAQVACLQCSAVHQWQPGPAIENRSS